jgi:hypothetical protein
MPTRRYRRRTDADTDTDADNVVGTSSVAAPP